MSNPNVNKNISEKYKTKEFLVNKKIKVRPISKPNLWKNLTGQVQENIMGDMFGEAKAIFTLCKSIKTGDFYRVIDDIEKVITPQFPDQSLTEMEFLSKMIGKDLSYHREENNFWKGDADTGLKPYSYSVPANGTILDLANPYDYIAYKVLLSNNKNYISPSYEERYRIPTYKFMLIDEEVVINTKRERIDLELKATEEFNKIKGSRELLMEFLICKDPKNIISNTASDDFLFSQVYDVLKSDPKYFLTIVEDDLKNEKVLVYKAVKAGALVKQGRDLYETPGGESLGKLSDIIHILKDPEKSEFKIKLQHQISNYKI